MDKTTEVLKEMYEEERRSSDEGKPDVIYEVETSDGRWSFSELKVNTYTFLQGAVEYRAGLDESFETWHKKYYLLTTDWRPVIQEFLEERGLDESDWEVIHTDEHDLTTSFTAVQWEDEDSGEWVCLLWLRDDVMIASNCRPRAFTLLPVNGRMGDEDTTLSAHRLITFACGTDYRGCTDGFYLDFLQDGIYGHAVIIGGNSGFDGTLLNDMVAFTADRAGVYRSAKHLKELNETVTRLIAGGMEDVQYFLPIKDKHFICPKCGDLTVATCLS